MRGLSSLVVKELSDAVHPAPEMLMLTTRTTRDKTGNNSIGIGLCCITPSLVTETCAVIAVALS